MLPLNQNAQFLSIFRRVKGRHHNTHKSEMLQSSMSRDADGVVHPSCQVLHLSTQEHCLALNVGPEDEQAGWLRCRLSWRTQDTRAGQGGLGQHGSGTQAPASVTMSE